LGRWRGQKTDGTGETPSTRRAAIGASGSRSWPRARAYLRRSEWSRQNGRRRTLARAAASNPLRGRVSTNRTLEAHDRVYYSPRRRRQVRRPKKSFHSLVDVVRGASQPLRGRVSANMNVRDPRSPTVLAMSTAPCASRPGDLLFTRRRRQRHLAPCPPSDARTVHEASVTAAARLPGVTGGRIDEASRARRRRGHHVECPRTPQTSLGPGSASALRSAKVASWQSRRRRLGASGRAFASHGLRLAAVEGDQRTRCAAAAVLHVGCRALVKCGVDYVARTRPNVWQREASATSRTGRCALTKVGRARSKYGAASRLARPRRSDGSALQACASLQVYALRLGCGAAGAVKPDCSLNRRGAQDARARPYPKTSVPKLSIAPKSW
jgi:hypothetical protein